MRITIDISATELVDFLSALSLSAEPPAKESAATNQQRPEYTEDEVIDFDPKFRIGEGFITSRSKTLREHASSLKART